MPDIYEENIPFTPPEPTNEELARIDRAALSGRLGPELRSIEIDIAYERADAQLNAEPPYPGIENLAQEFPGIDPRGKYTHLDTEAFARLTAIRDALPARPQEVRDFVQPMLDQLADPGSSMSAAYKGFREQCKKLRRTERAAQLAPSKDSHDMLVWTAPNMEKNAVDSKFLSAVRVMDYMAGTSDKAPTEAEIEAAASIAGKPYPKKIERLRAAPARPPQALSIHFQNFDHISDQQFFCKPENWGKSEEQAPDDIANVNDGTDAISRYAAATVDRTLQPLFKGIERFAERDTLEGLDRGGLITVDGKTVRSYMQEQYTGKPEQFDKWYKANVREMSNQLVSAGLMAGKRVEAFIPDANGNLPKEPTQLTKTGYEPSRLKKVTLNAWERHFAKHGFFKKKSEKAAEYQRIMAGREEIRNNYKVGYINQHVSGTCHYVENLFFEDYKKAHDLPLDRKMSDRLLEKGIKPGQAFRTTRSAHVTACICQLAAEGHSIQDILDPNKLQNERQAAGKLYMEKGLAKDNEWLGRTFFEGMDSLVKQAQELSKQVDLTSRSQAMEVLPHLYALSAPLFDAYQEYTLNGVREGFYLAAHDKYPEQGPQYAQQLVSKSNIAGIAGVKTYGELKGSLELGLPPRLHAHTYPVIDVAIGAGIRSLLKSKSGKDLFQRASFEETGAVFFGLPANEELMNLSNSINETPASARAASRLAQTGKLQSHMDIRIEQPKTNGKPSFYETSESFFDLAPGEDGKLHLTETKKRVQKPKLHTTVTLSAQLKKSMEKQQKAHEFQNTQPKLEEKKASPKKEAVKEPPKKAAPKKTAPVKSQGGIKR